MRARLGLLIASRKRFNPPEVTSPPQVAAKTERPRRRFAGHRRHRHTRIAVHATRVNAGPRTFSEYGQ